MQSKKTILWRAAPFVAVAASLAGCGGGGGSSNPTVSVPKAVLPASPTPAPNVDPTNGPVSATGRYQDLVFNLTTPKTVYARGEAVPLVFTVQNNSSEDTTFYYSNLAGAPYNGDILGADGQYVRGRIIYSHAGADSIDDLPTITIAAGETATFSMKWDQLNQSFNAQVPPGVYRIRGFIDQVGLNPPRPNGGVLTTDYLSVEVK